jgi:DNA polymerase-4
VPTTSTRLIYETAAALLDNLHLPRSVRLIGIGLSGFVWGVEKRQALLPGLGIHEQEVCEARQSSDRALDETIDEIRARFGKEAVQRGKCKLI